MRATGCTTPRPSAIEQTVYRTVDDCGVRIVPVRAEPDELLGAVKGERRPTGESKAVAMAALFSRKRVGIVAAVVRAGLGRVPPVPGGSGSVCGPASAPGPTSRAFKPAPVRDLGDALDSAWPSTQFAHFGERYAYK
ncbi:hypothetical protein GCM10010345_19680 [Streptomyces canarius]|uniref:Transposase IS111A/IS1328/IS1533 N-terminal domain-containing protein n=1 Tax=Streptomyces canarius TaxID=285453 RepID=A0ABQ3CMU5_9ACTN|nr:hypothetical protein GCM10010345_19680 [Streptomyces canarius]